MPSYPIKTAVDGAHSRRLLAALALLLAASAAQATPLHATAATKADAAAESADASLTQGMQDVLVNALSLSGIQYQYGGKTPETGFDCSGFVRYVFQQAANLTLPHGARALSQLGQSVAPDQLRPGDLVFFNTLRSAFSHVGIYLGNNRFIHAPSSGGGIHVVDMNSAYWAKRYNGARRLDSETLARPATP